MKSLNLIRTESDNHYYTLKNMKGMEMKVMRYGATITSLKIPISTKEKIDVVLGFDTLKDYIDSFELPNAPYMGAIVGRFAGRIKEAKLQWNGIEINLTQNHGTHQIHGGIHGFSKALWNVYALTSNAIILEYISPNNEENFPGELHTQIVYTITDQNELMIEMRAKSSEDTFVNLTQHSYFNLDGHSETIVNQELFVNSKNTLETNFENIPTGNFLNVANSSFDFNTTKKCPTMMDNTFVLNKESEIAAILYSKKNNLKMSVSTNQPAIHVYVGGNCFNQIRGKEQAYYHPLSGICFEAQNFPDAPNHSHFPSAVLKKNETYLHKTLFKFENL